MTLTTVKRLLCLRHLWILLAMPLTAGTVRIYVANKAGTTIDVIDPETNKVVKAIGDIESPEIARFSPDGSRTYITSGGENVLDVLDTKSGKLIKKVPLSGWANECTVTSDGRLILACIRNTGLAMKQKGALDIIDAASLEKVKSIPVRDGLHDLAVTRDCKYAAAGSPPGHFLIVFDLERLEPAWEVQYDQGVQPIAIENNPDGSGRRIFLQLGQTNGFSVVDFAKRAEVARIKYPDEPGGFGRGCEGISHGIGIAPDGKTLWANSTPASAVFVYSLPEVKLLGHVSFTGVKVPGEARPRGAGPAWITFTPDSKTVYVSTCGTRSVSAIDVQTRKEVARIPAGEEADRVSTLIMP